MGTGAYTKAPGAEVKLAFRGEGSSTVTVRVPDSRITQAEVEFQSRMRILARKYTGETLKQVIEEERGKLQAHTRAKMRRSRSSAPARSPPPARLPAPARQAPRPQSAWGVASRTPVLSPFSSSHSSSPPPSSHRIYSSEGRSIGPPWCAPTPTEAPGTSMLISEALIRPLRGTPRAGAPIPVPTSAPAAVSERRSRRPTPPRTGSGVAYFDPASLYA